jgi:hypothetical protein
MDFVPISLNLLSYHLKQTILNNPFLATHLSLLSEFQSIKNPIKKNINAFLY